MKNILKRILIFIMSKRKVQNKVVFESLPSFSGNSYVLYKKLIEEKKNEDMEFYWIVENPLEYKHISEKNVFFYKRPNNKISLIKYLLDLGSSKLMVTENAPLPKVHKKMYWLHLTHGTPMKDTKNYMYLNSNVDLLLYQSEKVKNIVSTAHNIPLQKMRCFGFPRNDLLIESSKEKVTEEYIVWLPTFRKHKSVNRVDSEIEYPYGMPIIHSLEQLKELNEVLIFKRLNLYVKPHFASDLSSWSNMELSNIFIIDESYLKLKGLQLYEFLGKSKGLITDYSSVYYDYLLVNKPIGLTVDDLEEYQEKLGFVFEDYYENIKGEYIYQFNNLIDYISNLSITEDIESVKVTYNNYHDSNSTVRLIEYLKELKVI